LTQQIGSSTQTERRPARTTPGTVHQFVNHAPSACRTAGISSDNKAHPPRAVPGARNSGRHRYHQAQQLWSRPSGRVHDRHRDRRHLHDHHLDPLNSPPLITCAGTHLLQNKAVQRSAPPGHSRCAPPAGLSVHSTQTAQISTCPPRRCRSAGTKRRFPHAPSPRRLRRNFDSGTHKSASAPPRPSADRTDTASEPIGTTRPTPIDRKSAPKASANICFARSPVQ